MGFAAVSAGKHWDWEPPVLCPSFCVEASARAVPNSAVQMEGVGSEGRNEPLQRKHASVVPAEQRDPVEALVLCKSDFLHL